MQKSAQVSQETRRLVTSLALLRDHGWQWFINDWEHKPFIELVKGLATIIPLARPATCIYIYIYVYKSAQIIIFDQPRFPWNKVKIRGLISLPNATWIGVRDSCEVANWGGGTSTPPRRKQERLPTIHFQEWAVSVSGCCISAIKGKHIFKKNASPAAKSTNLWFWGFWRFEINRSSFSKKVLTSSQPV